jgi:hypothetical protein
MSRSPTVFQKRARRQALAARHRPQQTSPPDASAGRFVGLCSVCGERHLNPDDRYGCQVCGGTFCSPQTLHAGYSRTCPDCGASLEDEDEGGPE